MVSPSIDKWYKQNIGEKYSEIIFNSPVVKKNIEISDKRYLREKFLIPEGSKIFIYIGILGRGRGIDLILDVFKNNDLKSHLVFLGYGVLKDQLDMISQAYTNIHVHAVVPHDEVVPIANSADVGLCLIQNVSLSDYFCLPNKLFEYCFSEIPVLASNFPDISHVVQKFNLGKCSNLDSTSICKVIKEFEIMQDLPKISTVNLHELSWDAQEDKLIELYNNLIAKIEKI